MPLAVGVLGALAFATELLLWAGVAVAVQAAVGGWLGWVLGLLVAVLVIVALVGDRSPRGCRRHGGRRTQT
jgi:cytochrome c oxidase assembly factor CtaG